MGTAWKIEVVFPFISSWKKTFKKTVPFKNRVVCSTPLELKVDVDSDGPK